MPVILRNKTNSVEIDLHANLSYTVNKGGFDVIYEDSGMTAVPIVHMVLKAASIINQDIKLDWRDTYIQPGDIPFTSAEDLRDTLLDWNVQTMSTKAQTFTIDSDTEEVILLAANSLRKMAMIYNNSTADLFIKYGVGASSGSFTVKLTAGSYFEMPYPCYTGQINGYWASKNGNVMITECT